MDMPKRPRSHQLEQASRAAFLASLPDHITFAEFGQPEYGLDGIGEVFDRSDDSATGMQFFVQLKGTDVADLHDALAVRLKRKTLNYYVELDLPVLIVRYHAPSSSLYYEWFHRYRQFDKDVEAKSHTIRLPESNVLTPPAYRIVVEQLRNYRIFASGRFRPPLDVSVFSSSKKVGSLELSTAMRTMCLTMNDMLKLDHAEARPPISLEVNDEHISFDLAGVTMITLPCPSTADVELIASECLLSIALGFETVQLHEYASRIAACCAANSLSVAEITVAMELAHAFLASHRIEGSVRLAARLSESDRPAQRSTAFAFLWPALMAAPSLDEYENRTVRGALESIVSSAEARGDNQQAALAYYNLANHLRAPTTSRAALTAYRKAARRDPAYRSRPYFWHEVAGVLYELGRYPSAAKAYACAQRLGDNDPLVRVLKGDALLRAGYLSRACH